MKLYHGTNTDFMAIDLNKSQRGKDFGCGFYLSESEKQAVEMAKFKVQLFGGKTIVQTYEFDEARLSDGLCGSCVSMVIPKIGPCSSLPTDRTKVQTTFTTTM